MAEALIKKIIETLAAERGTRVLMAKLRTPAMTKLLATARFGDARGQRAQHSDDRRHAWMCGTTAAVVLSGAVVLAEIEHEIMLDECGKRTMCSPVHRTVCYLPAECIGEHIVRSGESASTSASVWSP